MNYIDIKHEKIEEAKAIHLHELTSIITKRIEKYTTSIINKKFFNFHIIPNLKNILTGGPEILLELHNELNPKITSSIKKNILNIFAYQGWFDKKKLKMYDAYNLASNLDIPTCIYCNRIYTKTVISGSQKITRPSFDHWFSKESYPLLALSFFNLIPSCSICNSGVKGKTIFALDSHFHPYLKSMDSTLILDYAFSYDHADYSTFKFKIISNNDFSKNSVEAFKLEKIYEMHEDEIKDLRRIRDVYSPHYLINLKKTLTKANISEDEIYQLAFGAYINEDLFDRRPLSRMKRDILGELGILNHLK
ncbi:hypothetical protein [Sphingobacterium kitahiroshimense]|uniref:HNH endonuclease n=1 Tax=Sphingobacterium kitahiroshimense TaxID=470446 RepID=A0ABV0BWB0_9SPHI